MSKKIGSVRTVEIEGQDIVARRRVITAKQTTATSTPPIPILESRRLPIMANRSVRRTTRRCFKRPIIRGKERDVHPALVSVRR